VHASDEANPIESLQSSIADENQTQPFSSLQPASMEGRFNAEDILQMTPQQIQMLQFGDVCHCQQVLYKALTEL